nr:hypothetical protein [Tanacetum cinerariifolium]
SSVSFDVYSCLSDNVLTSLTEENVAYEQGSDQTQAVNTKQVDVAVTESGLGGRIDATNVTQLDLHSHIESDHWSEIYSAIQQHLQKIYNGKKDALKERYWVPDKEWTYDVERIRHGRPSHIFEVDWDVQIAFWNDPKNLARTAQNKQNRAKSKVVCRQGSRSIAAL